MSVAIGTKLHMNLNIVQFLRANLCTFFVNIIIFNYASLVILTMTICLIQDGGQIPCR